MTGEPPVKAIGCLAVRIVGFFGCVERPERHHLVIEGDLSLESASHAGHTFRQIASSPAAIIVHVLCMRGLSEIIPLVVQTIAIFVINFVAWIFPSHYLPDNAMFEKQYTVYYDKTVDQSGFEAPDGSGALSCIFSIPHSLDPFIRPLTRHLGKVRNWAMPPSQYANFWVMLEALAQICLVWQYVLSHIVLRQGCLVRNGAGARTLASFRVYSAVT